MKTYRTVPFNASIGERQASKSGADTIAKMMGDVINREAAAGWFFVSYETIEVAVNAGCLSALLGGKSSTVSYGVLVFEKTS